MSEEREREEQQEQVAEDVPTIEPEATLSLRIFRLDGTIEDLGEVNNPVRCTGNEVT